MRRAILAGLLGTVGLLVISVAVLTWAPLGGEGLFDSSTLAVGPASASQQSSSIDAPASLAPQPSTDAAAARVTDAALRDSLIPSFAAPEPANRRKRIHKAAEEMAPARRHQLRDFRLEMKSALGGLQRRMLEECGAVTGASFSLSLESVKGGIKIVNADVASAEFPDDPGLQCVQTALRGQLIRAHVEPGKRWQMPFAVHSPT